MAHKDNVSKALDKYGPWSRGLQPFIITASKRPGALEYVRAEMERARSEGRLLTDFDMVLVFFDAMAEFVREDADREKHEVVACPVCGGYARVYRSPRTIATFVCTSDAHRIDGGRHRTGTGTVSGPVPSTARTVWV